MSTHQKFGTLKQLEGSYVERLQALGLRVPECCATYSTDGQVITRSDLPPGETRWVVSRKELVLALLKSGIVSEGELQSLYGATKEELAVWMGEIETVGVQGMKMYRTLKARPSYGLCKQLPSLEDQPSVSPYVRTFAGVTLDALEQHIVCPSRAERILLPPMELKLLWYLFCMQGNVMGKKILYVLLYPKRDIQPKIIDVMVCKMRKKLAIFKTEFVIETVWGRGYRLRESAKTESEQH